MSNWQKVKSFINSDRARLLWAVLLYGQLAVSLDTLRYKDSLVLSLHMLPAPQLVTLVHEHLPALLAFGTLILALLVRALLPVAHLAGATEVTRARQAPPRYRNALSYVLAQVANNYEHGGMKSVLRYGARFILDAGRRQ